MTTILVILASFLAVALLVGAYFLILAKQDADEYNDKHDLP